MTGKRLGGEIAVPTRLLDAEELFPLYGSLADAFVGLAVQRVEEAGKTISCRAGCGACCRQLVPISRIEARHLKALIEGLPEPRRTEIRSRFAAARERLQEEGLLEPLLNRANLTQEATHELGKAYLNLRIPCPFLEAESCSIHPDRPLSCREYLVTSSPEHCVFPRADRVEQVEVVGTVSVAVGQLAREAGEPIYPWVPLILAEDAETEADQRTLTPQPGPFWVESLVQLLSRQTYEAEGSETAGKTKG